MKWLKNFLLCSEKPRTIVRVVGNKLVCTYLDSNARIERISVKKFKHSNKLKKFWEKYCSIIYINYDFKNKVFWSNSILRINGKIKST